MRCSGHDSFQLTAKHKASLFKMLLSPFAFRWSFGTPRKLIRE